LYPEADANKFCCPKDDPREEPREDPSDCVKEDANPDPSPREVRPLKPEAREPIPKPLPGDVNPEPKAA